MRASILAGINSLQLTLLPPGTAESVDERARVPDLESVPADVTVHVEIAPPSSQPHPLLDSVALKTPECVPIYFYALHSDRTKSDPELADTHVIFYIHGGGNVTGHPTDLPFIQFYIQVLRAVASLSGNAATAKCVLIAPSYRLATIPENTFPAALQDLVAAYDYVLGKGYDASNVVIAGDSVGGNHGQCARASADTTRGTDSALLQRSCWHTSSCSPADSRPTASLPSRRLPSRCLIALASRLKLVTTFSTCPCTRARGVPISVTRAYRARIPSYRGLLSLSRRPGPGR